MDTYKSNINVHVSLLNEQIIIIQYYTSKNFSKRRTESTQCWHKTIKIWLSHKLCR